MLNTTRGWTLADKLWEEEEEDENCNTVRLVDAMFAEEIGFNTFAAHKACEEEEEEEAIEWVWLFC